MIEVCVFTKEPENENWQMSSTQGFEIVPRIGDHIELGIGENETAYLYKVINVVLTDVTPLVGDVYAIRIGITHEVLKQWFEEN